MELNEHQNGNLTNGSVKKNLKNNKCLVDIIKAGKKCVWSKNVEGTEMSKFREWVNKKHSLNLKDYWDLYKWSVDSYEDFWEDIWHYFGVKCSRLYDKVLNTAPCFSDVEWFPGARLNYAENMLRYRDGHTALIYVNEENVEERVSYQELYEEVKLYAAAMKKHGVKEGDKVACYVSNRNETVYAMLATASIGGLFGGPLPFYGAKAASNIMKMIKPKLIFAVDKFFNDGCEYNLLKNLPEMVNDEDSVEKVIIIPSGPYSLQEDISNIKHSCFLDEFLGSGKDEDGNVPDLVFEQFPFNQPLFFGFTSGTTGLPKGLIHGAGNFLPLLRDNKLQNNFNRNDVILCMLPLGWNIWNIYISNLMVGATMLLYDGFPYFKSKSFFWDLISKYKVCHNFIVTSLVDKMEKYGIIPDPKCNLENLRLITIGGSPVKLQNVEYMMKNLPDHVCVANMYGATEFMGLLGSFDYNQPFYSGEVQAPSLGTRILCLNAEGKHVIGERGELVVANPTPAMPMDFFVDKDKIKSVYFGEFPGVWTQHDEIWFDPDTKGFVVLGRSDETLNPGGVRFGASEIYNTIHEMEELLDYLCVGQSNCYGDERVVLFVRLNNGYKFDEDLVRRINNQIQNELLSNDCVPAVVLQIEDIPYNLNRKRMEKLVKTIINSNKIPDVSSIRNPECLKYYCNIPELQGY